MRRSNPDCMSGGGQAGTDHPWLQRPIGLEENAGRRLSRLAYGGYVAAWRTSEARQVGHGLLPVRRPADVDYRLARQTTLDGWRRGSVGREVLCDAQPMLRRNAVECGTPTSETCPVCEDHEVAHVTYVFGPRLPAFGRCISTPGELERLNARKARLAGYVVEVCAACGWNHLVRVTSLGQG